MEGTGTYLRLPLIPFTPEESSDYALRMPRLRSIRDLGRNRFPTNPYAGATLRLWYPNIRPPYRTN